MDDDRQIVQRAMSRTLARRFTRGVPDYTTMTNPELCAAVDEVEQRGELPMWELVSELKRRLERLEAA